MIFHCSFHVECIVYVNIHRKQWTNNNLNDCFFFVAVFGQMHPCTATTREMQLEVFLRTIFGNAMPQCRNAVGVLIASSILCAVGNFQFE